MEDEKVYSLFKEFNTKYFEGVLGSVQLTWSPRMTLCAGKTVMRKRGVQSWCSIRLSRPLLSQRPPHDTVNTLLHEMIHAYLYIKRGHSKRDGHGPLFKQHMHRINKLQGSKITVYHNFRKEVNKFRVYVYRCDGPCVRRRPFFGLLRRAISRPPDSTDPWWVRHQQECGGTFHKIKGPADSASCPPTTDSAYASADRIQTKPSSLQQAVKSSHQQNSNNNKNMSLQPHVKASRTSSKTPQSMYEEDEVVQRIREKYGNTKRSIMISQQETVTLQNHRDTQERQRKGGVPLPVAARVHGHIRTTYTPKSHVRLNVQKYLDNYHRELNHGNSVGSSRVLAGQSSSHSHWSEGSYPRADRENLPNNSAVSGKLEGTRHNAFRVQDVDKYMKRLHDYRRGIRGTCESKTKEFSTEESGGQKKISADDGSTGKVSSNSAQVAAASHNTQLTSGANSSNKSKEQHCPICNMTVGASEYDRHLQACFGDDLDFDDLPEEPVTPVKSQKSLPSTSLVSDPDFFDDYPEDFVNSDKVKNNRGNYHVSGKNKDNKKDTIKRSLTGAGKWWPYWCEEEAKVKHLPCAPCPNCGCSVLEEEMPFHLKYCMCSDEDDDDDDDDDKIA